MFIDILVFALGIPAVGYLTSNKESFSDGVRRGVAVGAGIALVLYIAIRLF